MNRMSDTISKQDAIDAVIEWYGCKPDDIEALEEIIKAVPSAQPEIIRCKDCKHWFDIDDGRQRHKMCADVGGDWYCADAERREDE